jgi:hypothetical protein
MRYCDDNFNHEEAQDRDELRMELDDEATFLGART